MDDHYGARDMLELVEALHKESRPPTEGEYLQLANATRVLYHTGPTLDGVQWPQELGFPSQYDTTQKRIDLMVRNILAMRQEMRDTQSLMEKMNENLMMMTALAVRAALREDADAADDDRVSARTRKRTREQAE